MARSLTLLQMRTELRYLADIEGATERHTDAQLNSLINRRWARGRELVSEFGSNRFLSFITSTLTPDAYSMAWPANAVRIMALEIEDGGMVYDVTPGSLNERNENRQGVSERGRPKIYVPTQAPVESTTSVVTGSIFLWPTPGVAYTYRIWYLVEWTDISNDTFVFSDPIGMSQWVLWDCCAQIAVRDNEPVYAAAVQERERELATLRRLCMTQRQAPIRRSDTRARRARARYSI